MVGRRQSDGGVGRRNVVASVLERGTDALAALAHASVGKVHRDEMRAVRLDGEASTSTSLRFASIPQTAALMVL
jgi:hypothetical protein